MKQIIDNDMERRREMTENLIKNDLGNVQASKQMKAKEIVKAIQEGTPFKGGFNEWEAEEIIKDYARNACKEQRELCVENYNQMGLPITMPGVTKRRIRLVIKNTNNPELK